MSKASDVAIIGAGPYGLSLAAHLRSRGREPRVFGDPMKLWRTQMPKGMRLKGFSPDLVSHTSDHHALDKFAGRDVAVIGAGASALDVAALLHAAGANTALVARKPRLAFHSPPLPQAKRRPLTSRMRWPTSGIGTGWKSFLYAEIP
jgi:cation diffusion facilitator CzcD-associated flavoprotein CzcO